MDILKIFEMNTLYCFERQLSQLSWKETKTFPHLVIEANFQLRSKLGVGLGVVETDEEWKLQSSGQGTIVQVSSQENAIM